MRPRCVQGVDEITGKTIKRSRYNEEEKGCVLPFDKYKKKKCTAIYDT